MGKSRGNNRGMNMKWGIKTLYYGKIECPLRALFPSFFQYPKFDVEKIDIPYLGFLITGKKNILVDTGISESFIVNGKAWGGLPAEGGRSFVKKALENNNLKPADIDIVVYTHLHNDHAGNCDLFEKSEHIVQKNEWSELLDPHSASKVRKEYDPNIIPKLRELNLIKVNGDIEIENGIKLYTSPGHTMGSQAVGISTDIGNFILCGDTFNLYCNIFPHLNTIVDMNGNEHKITPPPIHYGSVIPSSLIYDYYDWYDSAYKLKILGSNSIEFMIPGHEPSIVGKKFP